MIHGKTRSKKSRDTVPLIVSPVIKTNLNDFFVHYSILIYICNCWPLLSMSTLSLLGSVSKCHNTQVELGGAKRDFFKKVGQFPIPHQLELISLFLMI
jgi:hypothetical protein